MSGSGSRHSIGRPWIKKWNEMDKRELWFETKLREKMTNVLQRTFWIKSNSNSIWFRHFQTKFWWNTNSRNFLKCFSKVISRVFVTIRALEFGFSSQSFREESLFVSDHISMNLSINKFWAVHCQNLIPIHASSSTIRLHRELPTRLNRRLIFVPFYHDRIHFLRVSIGHELNGVLFDSMQFEPMS